MPSKLTIINLVWELLEFQKMNANTRRGYKVALHNDDFENDLFKNRWELDYIVDAK